MFSCVTLNALLAYAMLAYVVASCIYVAVTRLENDRPFYDSLSEQQKDIRAASSSRRAQIFACATGVTTLVLAVWRPLECADA